MLTLAFTIPLYLPANPLIGVALIVLVAMTIFYVVRWVMDVAPFL